MIRRIRTLDPLELVCWAAILAALTMGGIAQYGAATHAGADTWDDYVAFMWATGAMAFGTTMLKLFIADTRLRHLTVIDGFLLIWVSCGVVGSAMWVSYFHIRDWAAAAGDSTTNAYLTPAIIDGVWIMASIVLLVLARAKRAEAAEHAAIAAAEAAAMDAQRAADEDLRTAERAAAAEARKQQRPAELTPIRRASTSSNGGRRKPKPAAEVEVPEPLRAVAGELPDEVPAAVEYLVAVARARAPHLLEGGGGFDRCAAVLIGRSVRTVRRYRPTLDEVLVDVEGSEAEPATTRP